MSTADSAPMSKVRQAVAWIPAGQVTGAGGVALLLSSVSGASGLGIGLGLSGPSLLVGALRHADELGVRVIRVRGCSGPEATTGTASVGGQLMRPGDRTAGSADLLHACWAVLAVDGRSPVRC